MCAIHGLSGHAFDTWMTSTRMWLRDVLPKHTQFQSSRIMTYGYNAALITREDARSRIGDFADALLALLGDLRSSTEERARPLLLVCHSLVA